MLRWRFPLGTTLIVVLIGLCWLDHTAGVPGAWLMPVAILAVILVTGELLALIRAVGLQPVGWTVYLGNLLVVLACWVPVLLWRIEGDIPPAWIGSWPLLALVAGALVAFLAEMRRFQEPGRATANLAAAIFAIYYVGLLLGFVVRLRLEWGVGALASLLIVVKLGDTGAYTVGQLLGRQKLVPRLSPGKTVEGVIGALGFATLGSWVTFTWLVPWLKTTPSTSGQGPAWGWLVFGLLVGTTGLLGDLAESMLKRDAGQKDSSRWLPGLGGVLDMLDSILLAAPVAYACWVAKLVG